MAFQQGKASGGAETREAERGDRDQDRKKDSCIGLDSTEPIASETGSPRSPADLANNSRGPGQIGRGQRQIGLNSGVSRFILHLLSLGPALDNNALDSKPTTMVVVVDVVVENRQVP